MARPRILLTSHERRVGEWLRSIHCAPYEPLFRDVNGDKLLECDQAIRKELGIRKVGDRVRILVGIKPLRKKVHAMAQRKHASDTPPSGSPPTLDSAPDKAPNESANPHPAYARAPANMPTSSTVPFGLGKMSSPPGSPQTDEHEVKTLDASRCVARPAERRRDAIMGSATSIRPALIRPRPPSSEHRWIRHAQDGWAPHDPRRRRRRRDTRRPLPNCKTSKEIIRGALKKFGWREFYTKNYCVYVLDGTEPDPARCRPISDASAAIIHAGEPGPDELQNAARIAAEKSSHAWASAITKMMNRTQIKLELLTGEPWKNIQYPISPASFASL
ncbi:MAG: ATP binding [Phylliscum demangeonii]|nr:MAG: ATP binding [Phylliscum demangeonii]